MALPCVSLFALIYLNYGRYCVISTILVSFFSSFVVLLALNQAMYAYKHVSVGSDISYYLKVDLPAYDALGNHDFSL